jgi:hypothetical protein
LLDNGKGKRNSSFGYILVTKKTNLGVNKNLFFVGLSSSHDLSQFCKPFLNKNFLKNYFVCI